MRRWFLFTLVLLCFPANRASACGEDDCAGELIPVVGGGSCTNPYCPEPPDPAPATSQFTRLTAMANGKLTLHDGAQLPAGCCAVQRKTDNYYLLINSEAKPDTTPGFRRYVSRRGLNDWYDLGFVSGIDQSDFSWMSGFLCPDPQYASSTSPKITMYFSAGVDEAAAWPPPGGVVMRATSGDDGATWTVDPVPALTGDGSFWPYMPSGVEFQGRHLLAVAWVCVDAAVHPEIRVYESPNGIDGWTHIATPVVKEDCAVGGWDDGAVNRPRMIVDPTGTELIMLFSGYPWDGTAYDDTGAITRREASLGVAVSADGIDWAVAADPILSPTNTPYWDTWSAIIPTLTYSDDAKTKLRVYYTGRGPGGPNHLGLAVAEAVYANLNLPPAPGPRLAGASPSALEEVRDGLGRAKITATPNPTTGAVTIGLDLSRIRTIGATDVAIFDITGRAVRTLWEGSSPSAPADLQWDGRESSGRRVSAGNYLVRVRVAGEIVGTQLITNIR